MSEQQNEQPVNNKRTSTEQQANINRDNKNIDNSNNKSIYIKEIGEIISYLNEKVETYYSPTAKNTIKHITARLNEGYTVADFKTVIDNKCAEWLHTDYAQYLRPDTLFGSKFESYLKAPKGRKKCKGSIYSTEGASFDISEYEDRSLFDD